MLELNYARRAERRAVDLLDPPLRLLAARHVLGLLVREPFRRRRELHFLLGLLDGGSLRWLEGERVEVVLLILVERRWEDAIGITS